MTDIMNNNDDIKQNNSDVTNNTDIKPTKGNEPNNDITYELLIEFHEMASQGIRDNMEDALLCNIELYIETPKCTSNHLCLFAVFDGHSGAECAKFCQENITDIIVKNLQKFNDINIVFNNTVTELDSKFEIYDQNLDESKQCSGSTACIVLIDLIYSDLWVCNVGDSRCIIISNNNTNNNDNNNNNIYKAKQLSIEHKPKIAAEKLRIENAGGKVTHGYLNGLMGVSRSIGDNDLKMLWHNKLLISKPDITHYKITNNDEYIVLGCDGLYDVFKNNEIAKFLSKHNDKSLNNKLSLLMHETLHVKRSKDNVSIILLKINHNKPINLNNISPHTPIKIGRFTIQLESDDDTDIDDETFISSNNNNSNNNINRKKHSESDNETDMETMDNFDSENENSYVLNNHSFSNYSFTNSFNSPKDTSSILPK